jgi:hypothetical protein
VGRGPWIPGCPERCRPGHRVSGLARRPEEFSPADRYHPWRQASWRFLSEGSNQKGSAMPTPRSCSWAARIPRSSPSALDTRAWASPWTSTPTSFPRCRPRPCGPSTTYSALRRRNPRALEGPPLGHSLQILQEGPSERRSSGRLASKAPFPVTSRSSASRGRWAEAVPTPGRLCLPWPPWRAGRAPLRKSNDPRARRCSERPSGRPWSSPSPGGGQ